MNSYERYKLSQAIEVLYDCAEEDGASLKELGYTSKELMFSLIDLEFQGAEAAVYRFYKEEFVPVLKKLNANNDVIGFYIMMQLNELVLTHKSHHQNDVFDLDDNLNNLLRRTFIVDRKLLIRVIDPLAKDKHGEIKMDISKIRNGLAYIRDKMINEIFDGKDITFI